VNDLDLNNSYGKNNSFEPFTQKYNSYLSILVAIRMQIPAGKTIKSEFGGENVLEDLIEELKEKKLDGYIQS